MCKVPEHLWDNPAWENMSLEEVLRTIRYSKYTKDDVIAYLHATVQNRD